MGKEYTRDNLGIVEAINKSTIILNEDFEDTFLWVGSGLGGDYTVDKYASVSYHKDNCMRMMTKTTTPAIGDWAMSRRQIYSLSDNLHTVSAVFRVEDHSFLDYIYFRFHNENDLKGWTFSARYKPSVPAIEVLDENNAWVNTSVMDNGLEEAEWHRLLFTADIINGTYDQVVINNLAADISHINLWDDGGGGLESTVFDVYIKSQAAFQVIAYIDDIKITNL